MRRRPLTPRTPTSPSVSGAGSVFPSPLSPSSSTSTLLSTPLSPSDKTRRVSRRLAGKRKSDDDRPACLTASLDGRSLYFLQGGWLQSIRIQSGDPVRHIPATAETKFLLSPDEKQVLMWALSGTSKGGQKYVKLKDLKTGKTVFDVYEAGVSRGNNDMGKPSDWRPDWKDLCVTPDWTKVLIMGETDVEVWSLEDGRYCRSSARPTDVRSPIFNCITPFHDNIHAAIAHSDKNIIMLWNIHTAMTHHTLTATPHEHTIGHVDVSPDDKSLLALSRTVAYLWDVEGRALLRSIDLSSHEPGYYLYQPLRVHISPDWRWLFVRQSSGNTVLIVDLEKGKIEKEAFFEADTSFHALCVLPGMRFLVTADYLYPETVIDGRVYLTVWDIKKVLNQRWYQYRGAYMGAKSKDGKRKGMGKCYFWDKSVYEGEWCDDERHGHGRCQYGDGSVYEGQWSQDVRCGQGVCTYHNSEKTRYEGEWKDDARDGLGTCYYTDGSRYEGNWQDDRRHGKGQLWTCMGSRYSGEWLNNSKNGQGTAWYTDGSRYEGSWVDDRWHGRGVSYLEGGTVYEGEFKRDKREGEGTLTLPTQEKYIGGWGDNMRHGKGRVMSATGRCLYDGYWLADEKAKAEDLLPMSPSPLSPTANARRITFLATLSRSTKIAALVVLVVLVLLALVLAVMPK